MEAAAPAFGRPRPVVKPEKPAGDSDDDRNSPSNQPLLIKKENQGKEEHESEDKTSHSSNQKDDLSCTKIQEEQLESARTEMGEVREENQRLKMSLGQIMKDYEALKMQFLGIVGREAKKLPEHDKEQRQRPHDDQTEETELVSLTLGRYPMAEKKKAAEEKNINGGDKEAVVKQALSLGLNCKFEQESTPATVKEANSPNRSLTNSIDHETKEDAGETNWPPSKGLKTMRSVDDDSLPTNPPKRARVCVRARCETTTMNDGCQWRKYGQKIAKGNPCPRAYYRCTGSPTCPVRKQVQRCADDMSILITTYEGNHNHPLPASATAMASTTSAAASMLLSGSSTSSAPNTTAAASSSSSSSNHALSFYSNSKQNFYIPNNSSIISSTSPTHPTITLDLTSNPSSTSNPSTHFGKFPSSFPNSRYPFTSQLDFGSSRNNVLSWNNGVLSYNRNNHPTTTPTNNIYQNYIQHQRNTAMSLPHQQPPLPDTIAAATKAITADPSFQSALAAALTSIIGSGGTSAGTVKSSARGEQPLFQLTSTATTTTNKGNGCGTSFLSNITTSATPSNSPPTGNMAFVPASSLPFSNPKSASASPGDHIDLTN
ncbi:probable WRKY transcription factor 72 isoform X1 [Cucurbita pepo subsp. pepo]|uniref:probable WRKY transcription factor 72 isoform X1 n=1 Tax=Cucurbita pepo subsp. pepo TaxID=3664 RepID=UPI000C9D2750|nr:probable WRKY transcription factor 72 isoform X1 [Cucurbita pepo subsp. pepo]